MANKNAIICDMTQGWTFNPKLPPCDRLATAQCAICERDLCPQHASLQLAIKVYNTAPPENPQHQPPKPVLTCMEALQGLTMCPECHQFLSENKNMRRTDAPEIDLMTPMRVALLAIIVELRAAHAADVLKTH